VESLAEMLPTASDKVSPLKGLIMGGVDTANEVLKI
jgi:hypothetical protein